MANLTVIVITMTTSTGNNYTGSTCYDYV